MKQKDMPKWKVPKIVFSIFVFLILILFIQYIYLSLSPNLYGINMEEFASNRNTYSTTLYAKRGTIYDKDGNTLALNVSSYTVIAYLDESRTGDSEILYHVEDKEMTAQALSPILNMEVETLLNLLNQDLYQVELGPGGRGITEITKKQIEELNLPGIDFISGYKRYYPNGDFASYIIGYAQNEEELVDNVVENTIVGKMGIEVMHEDKLQGINGYLKYQQDRFGYKIPDTHEERVEALNGNDIYLTIDSNIQRMLETALTEAQEKYKPDWITVSVMDAKTGDILGSASTPSFDPNLLNMTNHENPLTSFVYEPGSVMKIFTYMCAIDKGTYKGSDTFLSGQITYGDTVISDWNQYGWGEIDFDYGFEMSSNVGVSYIMERFLTKEDLSSCLSKYGFGDTTNIELPRELVGDIVFENSQVDIAAAAYGQGISTTPIQQLQALSIIANDGKMLQPNIISKIVDGNTNEVIFEREVVESSQIVSTDTVNYIKNLMYNTVHDTERNATAIRYQVEGLDVLGKTGTAEIFDNETQTYLKGWNDLLFSFSGIFPQDDPEIIIFISMKRPNTGNTSAIINTTQPLIESIAKYKGLIGSDNNDDISSIIELPSYINKDIDLVKEELNSLGVKTLVLGNGDKVIKQYPNVSSSIIDSDTVYLITNDDEYIMPDLTGFSRLEVITLLDLIGLDYEITGYGSVVKQSVLKDSIINLDEVINITLEPKHILEEKPNENNSSE